jgi:hypothetical protein
MKIRKIDEYGGGWYGHWMRIVGPPQAFGRRLDEARAHPFLHTHPLGKPR